MNTIKEDMTKYWSHRVAKFSVLRQKEFACEKHEQWAAELDSYLPKGQQLKALDIGTGTGFLAFLLAEKGHQVSAIDLTPAMITEARQLADKLKLPVDFYVMDAEKPDFPAKSFDLIVTRKLTWTLPNLPQAYQAWHELLKPGGVLVNFDADYCREKSTYSLLPHHAHQDVGADLMEEYERMKNILKFSQKPRPSWDIDLLQQAGFSNIVVDSDVWQRIYVQVDEFFDPTPGFAISATA